MTTQPDIFLSYNRADQAVASRYADAFAAERLGLATSNMFMDNFQFVAYISFVPQIQECHSCPR
jgi:hypothetical protein